MKYAVMLGCRTGTTRLVDYPYVTWESQYHVITWCVEADQRKAEQIADNLLAGSPREIRSAWVEEIML